MSACPRRVSLYISAWLVELRLGVRNPWDARGTDANQLGLGPKALYGVVMVPDVPREGKRLCPHVSLNGHIASAVPSDEALAIRSDQGSLPLLRGAFGGARDALPEDTGLQQGRRLPLSLALGCGLIPWDPRPARIVTPGLPEQVSDHKKGLPQRDRRVPWIVRTTHQGTPTPGSVGAYPQRLCLDAT